jgi:hypothetical protein
MNDLPILYILQLHVIFGTRNVYSNTDIFPNNNQIVLDF